MSSASAHSHSDSERTNLAEPRQTMVHDLRVPMRDSIELSLDLLVPDIAGPLPVILLRTPYDKTRTRVESKEQFDLFTRAGYIVALNDCRGRFNSGGTFFPYMNEHDDGYDTIEWIAAQEWCDGSVGMIGASYAGQVQWQAACRTPPHLKAIVPIVSPPSSLWLNEPVLNGVLMLAFAEWMVAMGRRTFQAPLEDAFTQDQPFIHALPVSTIPAHANVVSQWWQTFLDHPTYDEFWKQYEYNHYEQITVPSLNVTGWWDLNFPGAPLNFEGMRTRGATHNARTGAKLIIGPWPHSVNKTGTLSGVDFGAAALIDLNSEVLRFFNKWLKGNEDKADTGAPASIFVTGSNEWRTYSSFPVAGTAYENLYFHSSGHANTLGGNGVLSTNAPDAAEPPDTFVYDPANVAVTHWSINEGPVDDNTVASRDDVLCYTSAPLTEYLDVVGWVNCVLYAASSATDTDWHVRLLDVLPDGTSRFLCRGALRARFRESFERPTLLVPGEVTRFEFGMDATGIRFLPTHRIRIEVTSSWFSQYDRNMNGGSPNPFHEGMPVVAEQTVFHTCAYSSYVSLPVIGRAVDRDRPPGIALLGRSSDK